MKKVLGLMIAFLICLLSIHIASADSSMTSEMVENAVQTIYLENREYEIEVLVISETADSGRGSVKFRVNGEVTEELRTGEKDLLSDGSIIYVNRIWKDAESAVAFTFYGPVEQGDEQADIPCEGKSTSLTQGNKFTYVINYKEFDVEAWQFDGNKARFKLNGEVTNLLGVGNTHRISDGSEIIDITVTKVKDDDGKKVVTYCLTSNRPITELSANRVCCQNSDGKFLSTMEECINQLQGTPRYEIGIAECSPQETENKIDLSYFPKMFFDGDRVNAVFVVGDNAPADDVIASVDISVSFQKYGVKQDLNGSALASEIKSLNQNLISVGRPCDNLITAKIVGTEDCTAGLKPGQALVQLFDYNGYTHLVVFGHSKLETRQAARALSTQRMSGRKMVLDFNKDKGTMPQPSECKDSDGGMKQFIKGTAYGYGSFVSSPEYKGEDVERTDYCSTDSPLKQCQGKECLVEYYCRSPKEMDYKAIPCPNGCENGACIKGNEEPETEEPAETEKEPPISETKDKECVGCKKNGACMQFGIRLVENKVPVYCDIDSALKSQKENGKECQNSYECLSNSCNDGVCQSISEKIEGIRQDLQEQKGILEKIFGFFKKIFG